MPPAADVLRMMIDKSCEGTGFIFVSFKFAAF